MSIWTNKMRWALAAGPFALLLTACVPPEAAPRASAPGQLVLAGPAGFCIVENTRVRQGKAEFAALLPCASAFAAPSDAVLTIAVGDPASAIGLDLGGRGLATYFTGPEGRRALSRSGRAGSVVVHEVLRVDGAVLLRLTDTSQTGAGHDWRAVLGLQDRLVTLTARAQAGKDLPSETGNRLIRRMVSAMRRANAT